MKTLTEFSGFALKDAIAKKAALITEGKTEEEAQAAINELLKLADDTKVTFFKNASDMTSSRIDRVKRVVVAVKATETEKVPEAFTEREGHFYLIEFFPQTGGATASRGRSDDRFDRGGRGGDRGRGGGDRGRADGNRGGGERRPRDNSRGGGVGRDARERDNRINKGFTHEINNPPPVATESAEGGRGNRRPRYPRGERTAGPRQDRLGQDRPARGPRNNRGPRPEGGGRPNRGPQGPKGAGELRLVLKGQSQTTLAGSGAHLAATSTSAVASASAEGSAGSSPATS